VFHEAFTFTGDEPHYLLATVNLAFRHSVFMEEVYLNPPAGFPLFPRHDWHVIPGNWGRLFFGHGLGLPFLLTVPYGLGGLLGVNLMMNFLSSLTNVYIFKVCREFSSSCSAIATSLVFAFATLLLPYSNQVYPDVAMSFITIFSFYNVFFSGSRASLFLTGLLLGLSPALKLSFVPVLLLAGGSLVVKLIKLSSLSKLPYFISPVALLCGSLSAYNYWAFGSPIVLIPPYCSGSLLRGAIVLLLDRYYGLLVFSPVLLICIFGVVHSVKGPLKAAAMLALLEFLCVFIIAASYCGTGTGEEYPARQLISVLPLLCVPFSVALDRHAKSFLFKLLFFVLTYISLNISSSMAYSRGLGLTSQNLTGKAQMLSRVYFGNEFLFPALTPSGHYLSFVNYAFLTILFALVVCIIAREALSNP